MSLSQGLLSRGDFDLKGTFEVEALCETFCTRGWVLTFTVLYMRRLVLHIPRP